MLTNEWKIIIEVTPGAKGSKLNIVVEPVDIAVDEVHTMLMRAAEFYSRQLQAMQNIQVAQQLQQEMNLRSRLKV